MKKLSAYLALLFGIVLALAETLRNWGEWQWWPFWLVDYIAASLLIYGGICFVRKTSYASIILAGGWGFTCAMFYSSFWGHVGQSLSESTEFNNLTITIGTMWLFTIVGFITALLSARGSSSGY